MRPAQHYTMGGVRTDHTGESPTLKGLFAAGEAACWDMHGFNRLGGNSVAETVVAGMIVGEYIADFCDRAEQRRQHPDRRSSTTSCGASRRSSTPSSTGSGTEDASAHQGAHAGDHDRQGRHLPHAARTWTRPSTSCSSCSCAAATSGCAYKPRGANPELVTAYRVQKMLKLALCVAYGALTRTESRGAHFRAGLSAPQRRRVAEAHARDVEERGRHAAHARLRSARRERDGAAARLARLRREGLRRPPRHAAARRRSRSAEAEDGRRADASPSRRR